MIYRWKVLWKGKLVKVEPEPRIFTVHVKADFPVKYVNLVSSVCSQLHLFTVSVPSRLYVAYI